MQCNYLKYNYLIFRTPLLFPPYNTGFVDGSLYIFICLYTFIYFLPAGDVIQ